MENKNTQNLKPGEYVLYVDNTFNTLVYVVNRGEVRTYTWSLSEVFDAVEFLHEEGVNYSMLASVLDVWIKDSELRRLVRERYDV